MFLEFQSFRIGHCWILGTSFLFCWSGECRLLKLLEEFRRTTGSFFFRLFLIGLKKTKWIDHWEIEVEKNLLFQYEYSSFYPVFSKDFVFLLNRKIIGDWRLFFRSFTFRFVFRIRFLRVFLRFDLHLMFQYSSCMFFICFCSFCRRFHLTLWSYLNDENFQQN